MRNPEILADFSGELIDNFSMAGNGRSAILRRVEPPGVAPPLPDEDAATLAQVFEQGGSFHTVNCSSV